MLISMFLVALGFVSSTAAAPSTEKLCGIRFQNVWLHMLLQVLESVTPPDSPRLPNATLQDTLLAHLEEPYTEAHNTCNAPLPHTSTLERFYWLVHYLTSNGFYVCLVHRTNEEHITAVSAIGLGRACSRSSKIL